MDRRAFPLPDRAALASHFILRSDGGAVSVPATISLPVANFPLVHPFGKLSDGREARLYTLANARGIRADITDYGATVVRLQVPDREGRFDDVVLATLATPQLTTVRQPGFALGVAAALAVAWAATSAPPAASPGGTSATS